MLVPLVCSAGKGMSAAYVLPVLFCLFPDKTTDQSKALLRGLTVIGKTNARITLPA